MNLGWIDDTSIKIAANERGTILHEFGHALGLMHEHQSPARGGTLTLDEDGKLIHLMGGIPSTSPDMFCAAVYEYYMRTQNWSRDLVKQQIIDVYSTKDVSNFSQLDTKSIMMYVFLVLVRVLYR